MAGESRLTLRERYTRNPGSVHTKDGKWYMRLDKKSLGVEIPEEAARKIKVAMWAEKRATSKTNFKTNKANSDINCHRAALFAVGLVDSMEKLPVGEHYDASLFRPQEFESFNDVEFLKRNLKSKIGNGLGAAQIFSYGGSAPYIVHSFLVGFDERDRAVCFEKIGYNRPFRIVPLELIWSTYGYLSAGWNAAPISTFEDKRSMLERQLRIVSGKM